MQVTEDKHNDLLKWNSLTGPVPSCYLVDSFDGDYHEDVSEMIVKKAIECFKCSLRNI